MRAINMPRDGLPVTTARDMARDESIGQQFTLKTEVVIVGSGAGGAMTAYELAKAGRQVLVLEAGRYHPSSLFTEHLGDTMTEVYRDQATQFNTTADVLFAEGACVGGSTVIGACVMQMPPDSLLRRWETELGLSNLAPARFKPLLDEVGKEQYLHLNEAHEINTTAHKVIQGCERMGFSWKPVSRNVRQCALTGHCLAGCPSDRKMSSLVTHLPWAVAHGARLMADTEVTRVLISNGRAYGVEAVVRDPDTGRKIADLRVEADVVVAAGGAIQTPLLLQRSQIPDPSGQVGKNMAVQPFVQVLARFKEELHGFRGALVGVEIDHFVENEGYMFFSALAEPEQLMIQGNQGAGADHIRFMKSYKHLAGLNAFAIDEGRGEVTWKGGLEDGRKVISWNPSRSEFEKLKHGAALAARVFFAAGAEEVFIPSFQQISATSVFDLDPALDEISYGVRGLYSLRINSFSAHGTCRMGVDRYQAVANARGEVYDVKGLFIADASLIPEPMPSAPHWTVQALAKQVAQGINQRSRELFLS
ncbi:GMC family oxidoreductase [Alcanivorax sp. JB21]|uniref:GMC family oxidoreductase n=1 Tax=Alcanivorax limicola TaxID=2874102 RepID=UPI001CBE2D4E|nr:GMC family oxidoreductase [Alcanivorax limicola]MBZ2187752.1 GMC family oxidoreductase [Alcanivorax limicola]